MYNWTATQRILAVTTFFVGLLLMLSILPYQADDAYITYQYAKNILVGNGFVFNANDPAVEGFSSPLWLAILVLGGTLFGVSALPSIAALAGVFSYLGIGFLAWRISRSNAACLLRIAILISIIPGICYYAITGLDQILFVFFVAYGAKIYVEGRSGKFHIPLFFLAAWARPEAPAIIAIGIVILLLKYRQDFKSALVEWIKISAPLISGYVALIFIRAVIFSDIFPNTYYAKQPELASGIQ